MKHFIVGLVALFVFTNSVVSAAHTEDSLSTYQITNVEDSKVKEISEKFEIIRKIENGYEVLVSEEREAEFLNIVPSAQLTQKSSRPQKLKSWLQRNLNTRGDGYQYHSYNEVVETVVQLAETYPELVSVVEYGKSANGNSLFAVKISDNVAQDEDEPELMITSATHGDEIITTEITLALIKKLAEGYGTDQRITNMVNDRELYFIPIVNADGFIRRARYDNGQDPNRSYPYPENPNAVSTPSIEALIKFFQSRNFVGSLDFHAYGELTMYPWAYTLDSTPKEDKEIFHNLAKKMAATNGYTHGPISKVIYVAKGSSADYYYWTRRTIALAVEVGSSKSPYQHEIPNYINEQVESTWIFIEHF